MTGLRIWHVGAQGSPDVVDGVNSVVWALARAQTTAGHDVSLLTLGGTDHAADSITVLPIDRVSWTNPPDIGHLHSVFVPQHALLARRLRARGIPYVVSPHGGVAPFNLTKSRTRLKSVYSLLVERPQFRSAAALTAVLLGEAEEIRSYLGPRTPPVHIVGNPVGRPPAGLKGKERVPDVVYLGRFDVVSKGLDRWLDIARRAPGLAFGLYGSGDRAALPPLPPNVSAHGPLFGDEKWEVLASARLYLQTSRNEAFGISIVEALAAGTPCALSAEQGLARPIADVGAGTILPGDPAAAAGIITSLCADDVLLARQRECGLRFAEQYSPEKVAERCETVYREALGSDN